MDSVDVDAGRSELAVDSLTVLLTALSLPAERAGSARRDLTAQLVQKFGARHPRLQTTLSEYAEDPETYREPARKVLRDAGADREQGIVDAAVDLLKASEQNQPGITGGLVGQLNAQGGRVLVAQRIDGNVYQGDVAIYATAELDPRERKNRGRMLQRVRGTWIEGFLDDSLHGAAAQTVGMQERPEAVPPRWGMVVQQLDRPARTLAPDTTIAQVFDAFDGDLLILGDPGSGKTTLLLELTRALLDRAERDEALAVPVVFPLAPWATKRLPLADWLVDELNQRYDVPRQIGLTWVAGDRILPLLDGLDEVAAEHRAACVEAINLYREGRSSTLATLVVTSRVADYDAVRARLHLRGAVVLQPLRREQIDAYLASAGPQLAGARAALEADATLLEMASSPLLLSTITVAYQGAPATALPMSGTLEERRARVFATYVDQMLKRRAAPTRYSRTETLHWLGWLANALFEQNQTVLYLERMQGDWLATSMTKWSYTLLDRLGGGVALGILAGLFSGLLFEVTFTNLSGPTAGKLIALGVLLISALFGGASARAPGNEHSLWLILRRAIFGALVVGLCVWPTVALILGPPDGLSTGLLFAAVFAPFGALAGELAGGPSVQPRRINVVESLRWSATGVLRSGTVGVIVGLILGVPSGLIYGLSSGPLALLLGLATGLLFGLAFGLVFGLVGALVGHEVEAKLSPNQGIRRSARTSILTGLVVGVPSGLVFGLLNGNGLLVLVGLLFAPTVALIFGGYACVSHVALRLVLSSTGALPLRTVSFLDYATERVFLRKVGGGYIFVHRLLQEHFADIDERRT